MASIIKVTVTRTRGGRSPRTETLSERFTAADSHPGSDVISDCKRQVERKFRSIYGEGSVSTTIAVT